MSKKDKASLIEGMVQRRQWKMNYKSIENTVSKLPNRKKRKAFNLIDELVKEGWAEYHKNGSCISLTSSKKGEIRNFLEKHGDMDDWMLDSLF